MIGINRGDLEQRLVEHKLFHPKTAIIMELSTMTELKKKKFLMSHNFAEECSRKEGKERDDEPFFWV